MVAGAEDLLRESPQVVHQDQAEHDRDGPQFANRQRRDRLKGVDEMGEVVLVHAAITMGHEFHGDRVDARQAAQRAAGDLGEEPIIAARQIGVDLEQGFGNDVKVVEQPFGVGTKVFLPAVSLANLAIGAEQAAAVANELLKQRPAGHDERRPSVGGQMAGVDFKAIKSEYLRANRLSPVSVGEKTAWPNPDGDVRGRFLGL